MIPAINNYAYLPSLRLIKQVETKSYKVKLLSWNKMSYKPISYHLYLCWQTTSGNIFIWAQLNNVASTVITVDLRVWREKNLYEDELLCLAALHWSCSWCLATAPLPRLFALWLCIGMCRVAFHSLTQPCPLSLLGILLLWHQLARSCVCISVASAGGRGCFPLKLAWRRN